MNWTKLFVTVALVALTLANLLGSVLAGHKVVVRDPSGKVIERRYTTGNKTIVRDAKGRKIRVEIVRGKKREIRDPSGRLIRVERIQ